MTVTSPAAPLVTQDGRAKRLARLLHDQRKTILVAVALVVADFWILGQLGDWVMAGALAGGIVLGLVNHLATEWWLMGVLSAGAAPSRAQMMVATTTRLVVLAAVAVACAVVLWPEGVALLLGLALFRLIALVMTGLPLLKELKNQ